MHSSHPSPSPLPPWNHTLYTKTSVKSDPTYMRKSVKSEPTWESRWNQTRYIHRCTKVIWNQNQTHHITCPSHLSPEFIYISLHRAGISPHFIWIPGRCCGRCCLLSWRRKSAGRERKHWWRSLHIPHAFKATSFPAFSCFLRHIFKRLIMLHPPLSPNWAQKFSRKVKNIWDLPPPRWKNYSVRLHRHPSTYFLLP